MNFVNLRKYSILYARTYTYYAWVVQVCYRYIKMKTANGILQLSMLAIGIIFVT